MKQILRMIAGLLIGVVIGLVGAAVIVVLFMDVSMEEYLQKLSSIAWGEMMLAMLVGVIGFLVATFLHIIIHEGGHLVCGLLTGYRFVSFRVFNWTFIRESGKLRIKHFSVAGTGGQCLMAPPNKPLDEIPVTWYNLGGVLANLVCVGAAFLFLQLTDNPFVETFLIIFIIFGLFLILMNGIPMTIGGVSNDANNVILLRKDKTSKRALMIQLEGNALAQQGVRPCDMPSEWFLIDEAYADYKNPLLVNIRLMAASRLLDEEKWEEAYVALTGIYEHKADIMGLYVKEVACELLFSAMVTGRTEQASSLYADNELKNYIQQFKGVMSSKQRILCAVALYLENDSAKAQSICETLQQQQHHYLMQGEVKSDLSMMNAILHAPSA